MATDQRNERRHVVRQKAQIVCSDGSIVSVLLMELSQNGACILSGVPATVGAQLRIRAPLYVTGRSFNIELVTVARYSVLESASGKHRVGLVTKEFIGDSKALVTEVLTLMPHL